MNAELPRPAVAPTTPPRGARPALSMRTLATIQKGMNSPPVSLAFFAALNDCITATASPHPVLARNVDIVSAWRRWTAWQEGQPARQSVADRIVANPRNNFEKCIEVVKDAMRVDPIWKQGVLAPATERELDTAAVFAAAPLMYWHWPHALVELTPALQQLLDRSDLGGDIPVGLLRPPMPACYIRFGEKMQPSIASPQPERCKGARIEGVYVFESVREQQRAVALVAIWAADDQAMFTVSTIDMIIGDETRALVDVIADTCAKQPSEAGQRLHFAVAQLCIKVFLYWNVEQARQEEQLPYTEAFEQLKRLGPKKAAKLRRHVDKLYDRVLLGPLTLPGHHGEHGEVSPHWRRGHFRMQPHGPHNSLRKVLFIAPTLVRADRLEDGATLVAQGRSPIGSTDDPGA